MDVYGCNDKRDNMLSLAATKTLEGPLPVRTELKSQWM